jgi:hypothetical protein
MGLYLTRGGISFGLQQVIKAGQKGFLILRGGNGFLFLLTWVMEVMVEAQLVVLYLF